MIFYDRIDAFEGIIVNKASESKECDIYHYWYFFNKIFKFKPSVCNGCHHLLMMSISFSGLAILNIKNAACCCIISGISKWSYKANAKYRFDQKKQNIIKHKNLLPHIKPVKKFKSLVILKLTFTTLKVLFF